MRIGLDIDGVMYQWDRTARYMLLEVLPDSPYSPDGPLGEETKWWNYIQDNVTPDHWKWLWTEGVRLGLFRYGHLYRGTIQAVKELATLGEIVIITHRPKQAVNDTLDWLSYQKFPLADIHILTGQEPKSSVMPQCDVYLDDRPENCFDYLENTSAEAVALMRRPWNKDAENITIVRPANFDIVDGWPDFVNLVKKVRYGRKDRD